MLLLNHTLNIKIINLKKLENMSIFYRLKASQLDHKFLETLKAKFGDKEIVITVSEFDETAYLFKNEANKNRLLNAVKNVENQTNLIEFSLEEIE